MKTHKLKCPTCNKLRIFKSNTGFYLAKKLKSNCRKCSTLLYAKRNGSCNVLLNETNETYYWLGFILADGHIDKSKRLIIRLGIKDSTHLLKLAIYLKTSCSYTEKYCKIALMDTIALNELSTKFDIHNHKTINPPNLEIFNKLSRNKLLSLFAGFVDGDGSIRNLHNRKDFNLTIKCHKNWLSVLEIFSSQLLKDCTTKINNAGFSFLSCGNSSILKELKKEILKLELPLMERKWDIIDLNFKGRPEKAKENLQYTKYYIREGYSQKQIAEILGLSASGISLIIKRNKL